jgi:hypothetical protein
MSHRIQDSCDLIAMGDNKEKTTMRKLGFMLVTAATLIAGSSANSVAAPVAPDSGIRSALADVNLVEKAQYVWGGRRYCWYQGGWSGPGWYWCGYAWRRGFGWGGPVGWNGWAYRAPGPYAGYRGYYRRW